MRLKPIRAGLAFWAAALAALIVSHDAVFLVQVGPGAGLTAALRGAAHEYWGTASALVALAVALLGIAAISRLRHLRRTAAALGATKRRGGGGRAYLRRVVWTWAAMAAAVAIGFAVQENVEHVLGHGHLLGVEALAGPEYPLAMPVIGAVTLLASLLAAAIRDVERALIAAISHALRGAQRRPIARLERPPLSVPRPSSAVATAHSGRGPPPRLVTVHSIP